MNEIKIIKGVHPGAIYVDHEKLMVRLGAKNP